MLSIITSSVVRASVAASQPDYNRFVDHLVSDIEDAVANGRPGIAVRYSTNEALAALAEELRYLSANLIVNHENAVVLDADPVLRAKVLDAMVLAERLAGTSIFSARRYKILRLTWERQSATFHRLFLLDTFALARRAKRAGGSLIPALESLAAEVVASGSLNGLHSPLVYLLDDVSRRSLSSAERARVLDAISSIASVFGVSPGGLVKATGVPGQVLSSYPFGVPFGRSISDTVLELRPDMLMRFAEVSLGAVFADGLLSPMRGIEDFVSDFNSTDCTDIPTFQGLTLAFDRHDSTRDLGEQERQLGGTCGNSLNSSGAGDSLGMSLGAGVMNVCLNNLAFNQEVNGAWSPVDQAIRSELINGRDCFRQSVAPGGCEICVGPDTQARIEGMKRLGAFISAVAVVVAVGNVNVAVAVGAVGGLIYITAEVVDLATDDPAPEPVPQAEAPQSGEPSDSPERPDNPDSPAAVSSVDGLGRILDCAEYREEMRASLLAFNPDESVSYPAPEGSPDLSEVDDCRQTGPRNVLTGCRSRVPVTSCLDPQGCCRGEGDDAEAFAQIARASGCESVRCAPDEEAISNGTGCSCSPMGSGGPSISTSPSGPPQPIGIDLPPQYSVPTAATVDALFGHGELMTRAFDQSDTATADHVLFLRGYGRR